MPRRSAGVKTVEDLGGGAPQIFDKGPFHVMEGEGGHAVEEIEKSVAIVARQDVRLQRKDLAEFEEAAANLFEEHAQPLRPAHAASAEKLGDAVFHQ